MNVYCGGMCGSGHEHYGNWCVGSDAYWQDDDPSEGLTPPPRPEMIMPDSKPIPEGHKAPIEFCPSQDTGDFLDILADLTSTKASTQITLTCFPDDKTVIVEVEDDEYACGVIHEEHILTSIEAILTLAREHITKENKEATDGPHDG